MAPVALPIEGHPVREDVPFRVGAQVREEEAEVNHALLVVGTVDFLNYFKRPVVDTPPPGEVNPSGKGI